MTTLKRIIGKDIGEGESLLEVVQQAKYNLDNANLRSAELQGVDLCGADLRFADLSNANLRDADLRGANLSATNLIGTCFRDADLRNVNLQDAAICYADLRGANLLEARLKNANLTGANLSGAKGLPSQRMFIKQFERNVDGVVVYKAIGNTMYPIPEHWTIEPGKYLEEVMNHNRTDECGCGVNFATREWCEEAYPCADIWACLIEWEGLADLCVPYSTNGQARCGRLKLLQMVRKAGSD